MNQKNNFDELFYPKSIAVIGASETEGKVGNSIAKNVIGNKYKGNVYFVNPKHTEIFHVPCYKTIEEIPVKKIDCAIVVVPAKYVEEVIRNGSDKCKNYVVISAGFGEKGIEGHNREMRLLNLAQEKGLKIMGPNCLGFINSSASLNASFASGMPNSDSSTVFISQSGALAVAAMDKARKESLGFSQVISIGNKMQVDITSLIDYFSDKKEIETIAIYSEGVNNGEQLIFAIQEAIKKGKQIIILKSGVSETAKKTIALHTGSLAGSDDIFSAALKKSGAIRVDSFEELFSFIRFLENLNQENLSLGFRVAIVTNAGGAGVLAVDEIEKQNLLTLSNLSGDIKNVFKKNLPEEASVENPIDILGDADEMRYKNTLEKIIGEDNVDIVFAILTPQDQTPVENIASLIIDINQRNEKLVIPVFIGGDRVESSLKKFDSFKITSFKSYEDAVQVVGKVFQKKFTNEFKYHKVNSKRREIAFKIFDQIKDEKRNSLYFAEAKKLANLYELPLSKFWDVTEGMKASVNINYPCVAKIDNPKILHKTDRGGIILPITTNLQLLSATKDLLEKFKEEGSRVVVQPLYENKTELILGLKRDDIFGLVIMIGLGGIYTEIFKLVDFMVVPLSRSEIKRNLKNSKISFLFQQTRGQEKYDLDEMVDIIYSLSILAEENPEISMIDINPLLIYNDRRKAIGVDFKVMI